MSDRWARIAVIAVAVAVVGSLLITGVLVAKARWTPSETVRSYRAGDVVRDIAGLKPSSARIRVVLFVTAGCSACRASRSFHELLRGRFDGRPGVRVLIATPERDVAEIREAYGLRSTEVLALMKAPHGVPNVPAVLLLDANSKVLRFWQGRLWPEQEAELLSVLASITRP